VGYRIDFGDLSLAYIPDNELANDGFDVGEGWRRRIVDFLGDVDVLLHDAMFTEDEYRFKADWGHSTFDQAVDLATEVGAKKLMFFHHDPRRTDRDLEELVDLHREQAATRGLSLEIDAAAEGDHVLCV
jgi:ribonuclease BN (tRNA processing enzyme)